jgi:hypothetical protein
MFRFSNVRTSFFILLLFPLLSQAQDASAEFFSFEQDVRVFVAQAFYNVAGYDHEWRKEGMHPLRAEIRSQLFRTLDSSYVTRLHAFEKTCSGDWSSWGSYALLTAGPPDFRLNYNSKTTPYGDKTRDELRGFQTLLAEFYVKAHVSELWQRYEPRFQKLSDLFRPHARTALSDIIEYCRLESDYFERRASRMHVIFAPLLSYFTAQTDQVGDVIYLIFGPQVSEPSPSSFYHEALHHVLSPLTEQLDSNVTNRFRDLYALATSNGHLGYGHIDEAFVRTMGCILSGKLFGQSDSTVLANVTNEYKLGFILCLSIYEQLKQYETSRITFAQYFPKFIATIDVEREKQRWHQLTKNAK